jgi:nucleoside-diphosphate-sugar epimerase
MRILIAGGAGDVGRHLADDFSRQGDEVRILDRAPGRGEIEGPIQYVQGDLNDRECVQNAVEGCETVIHLAWSFADDPQVVFAGDIRGHVNLLEAASAAGVKSFIYASTATVYGRAVQHPVTENHPCLIVEARKPIYALGKYVSEELCRVYHRERGLPTIILRFWWAFGESIGGRHLRELIGRILKNQPLDLVRGAGGAFLSMGDLGKAMKMAMVNPVASGQIYNLGSFFLTWEEIVARVIALAGSKSNLRFIPSEQWRGPAFLNEVWDLSWKKAEKDLQYEPPDPSSAIEGQFMNALRDCLNRVKKENS